MNGFLFDLDGTLINSLEDIAQSMNRALTHYGLATHAPEAYKLFVGNGAKVLTQRATQNSEKWEGVYDFYMADYQKNSRVQTQPYDGIMDMLEALMNQGCPLAVFSNKPHRDTLEVVNHFFPNIPFKAIRGQVEGIPVKPDPEGALVVANEMGLSPQNIYYVGDSGVDMACAVNAGMIPVGVTWGFREKEELTQNGAKYIIYQPPQLLTLGQGTRG